VHFVVDREIDREIPLGKANAAICDKFRYVDA
jgi:hypothetical protein